jgi:hypothetical protein
VSLPGFKTLESKKLELGAAQNIRKTFAGAKGWLTLRRIWWIEYFAALAPCP